MGGVSGNGLTESGDGGTFGDLDHFSANLNQIVSFGDFVSHAIKKLLQYGNTHLANQATRNAVTGRPSRRGPSVATIRRLTGLIAKNIHRSVPFFNSADVIRILLRIQSRTPLERRPPHWCALCGTFSNRAYGHKTTHHC